MAWMATATGGWHEPITACWLAGMAEIRIAVVGCDSMHLTVDEAKQLIGELNSAVAEFESTEMGDDVIETSAEQRARSVLNISEAG